MSGGKNLAQKYSKTIDERFERESQAVLALNSHYASSASRRRCSRSTVTMTSTALTP